MRALRFSPFSPRALYAAVAGRRRIAAWAGGPGSPLRLTEMPVPPLPGPDWVRVEVRLGGICGSDLKLLRITTLPPLVTAFTDWRRPIVLGHEIVGTVVAAGASVAIPEGTRVVAEATLGCADKGFPACRYCESGSEHLCANAAEAGALQSGDGFGFNARYGGGWAEQLVAPARRCIPVPPGLPDTEAVLAEPLACAVRAVRRAEIAGEGGRGRALVIGPGTVGLSVVMALHGLAPQVEVTVAGISEFADDRARRLGAAHLIHGKGTPLVDAARGVTGGVLRRPLRGGPVLDRGGFDTVYDCVGSAQTIDDGLRMTRPGGELVLVGTAGQQRMDWSLVWFRELRVVGSGYYGRTPGGRSDLADAVDLLDDARPGLVTHRFDLDQAVAALATATAGPAAGAIKVAFSPNMGTFGLGDGPVAA